MFLPNTKVVCVDDKFPDGINDVYNALPRKGSLYTVRDIVPGQGFGLEPTVAVYLDELVNLPNMHGIEPGFAPHRFVEPEYLHDSKVEHNRNRDLVGIDK